jgi:hypothetical protein
MWKSFEANDERQFEEFWNLELFGNSYFNGLNLASLVAHFTKERFEIFHKFFENPSK